MTKAKIPTNVNWTVGSLLKALGKLDPGTELVFGNPVQGTQATQGTNKCWCGCGAPTKNKFAPGHDARFHGEAVRAAKGMIPVRTDFIHSQAREDWMKWFNKTKAEIAAKAIPVIEAVIEEVTEVAMIDAVSDDVTEIDTASDEELIAQLDDIG